MKQGGRAQLLLSHGSEPENRFAVPGSMTEQKQALILCQTPETHFLPLSFSLAPDSKENPDYLTWNEEAGDDPDPASRTDACFADTTEDSQKQKRIKLLAGDFSPPGAADAMAETAERKQTAVQPDRVKSSDTSCHFSTILPCHAVWTQHYVGQR